MINLSHKDLEVWKKSLTFVTKIYQTTVNFPKEELYGLVSQLRRASISVLSNLSEGASRRSNAERKRFFEIARSSLIEVDAQIEISIKLLYCSEEEIKELELLMNEIFAMLSALIKKYS